MTKSEKQAQQNIYMAMMDLKNDIQLIKSKNKGFHETINNCHKLCQKTYDQMNDKFEQTVKFVTNAHNNIIIQNKILQQQNEVHNNLTKSNQDLIQKVKLQNDKLQKIFDEQRANVERVLQANQLIVNQQLTAICKQQQGTIQKQIKQYNDQNIFIEQQKMKIELAFEAVANFQNRNRSLQQKLLKQKQEIQSYIVSATNMNQQLVINLIYSKSSQSKATYEQNHQNMQNILNQFYYKKQQILKQLQNNTKNYEYRMQKNLSTCESYKNQTARFRSQGQNFRNEQMNKYQETKRQVRAIKQMKENIDRNMKNMKQNLEKDQSMLRSQVQGYQTRLLTMSKQTDYKFQEQNRKERNMQDKINNIEKRARENENKFNQVSRCLSQIERNKKDIQRLQNRTNQSNEGLSSLQNRVRALQSSEKGGHHRHHH